MHTYVGGRKAGLPREVGPTPEGKVNATAQNAGFAKKKNEPTSVEKGLLISRRCCDTQLSRMNMELPHKK